MLRLEIPGREFWDEKNECFIQSNSAILTLEHSLLSISKWESTWKKPFLDDSQKTKEEMLDYVRCMTISLSGDSSIYNSIDRESLNKIFAYIDDPMTATTFREQKTNRRRGEFITSELIYYWMICCGIPFDPCEKWHINRLMTLIHIYNVKSEKPKKMSQKEWAAQRRSINESRMKALHSKG